MADSDNESDSSADVETRNVKRKSSADSYPLPDSTNEEVKAKKPRIAISVETSQKPKEVPNVVKSSSASVAKAFNNEEDDDDWEEMPPEAKTRMRNIGRNNGFRSLPQSKKELVLMKEEVDSWATQVETLKQELEEKLRQCTDSESEEEDEVVRRLQAQLSKMVPLNSSTGPVEDARVVNLDVSIPKNACVQKELEPFIEKMQNCRDVTLCIRGLEKYETLYLRRQKVFKHFTTNKPLVASLGVDKLGREMLLKNRTDDIRATVVWTFEVEETGHLTPVISLRVERTKLARFADKHNSISELASVFQDLLELYGIERAITDLIRIISMQRGGGGVGLF